MPISFSSIVSNTNDSPRVRKVKEVMCDVITKANIDGITLVNGDSIQFSFTYTVHDVDAVDGGSLDVDLHHTSRRSDDTELLARVHEVMGELE